MFGGGRVTQVDLKKWEELVAQNPTPIAFYAAAFPTCDEPDEPEPAPINYLALNREFS